MEQLTTEELSRRRRLASAGFLTLLTLSVFWPSPVVSINRLWLHQELDVDELSFLGRQAPSWDALFWGIAAIFTLAVLQSTRWQRADFINALKPLRRLHLRVPAPAALVAAAVWAVLVGVTWFFLDAPLIARAELWRSDTIESLIRIANRFGGGMNPAMIVIFLFVGGVVYRFRPWVESAMTAALAGLAAGVLAQLLKKLVGRSRPELWLGPFEFARDAAASFPSGHTVGAFAIGMSIVFTTRSTLLRVACFVLASGVGIARIFGFRHWPSDVLASALIGTAAAWIFARAVTRLREA